MFLLLSFSNIDLYFLTSAVIAQIFNPIAELVVPIGILTKELEVKVETHTATAEAKIRK